MQETKFKVAEIAGNSAEIMQKVPFQNKEIKISFFKSFFLNGKSKKFLEFDVEKDDGIIFFVYFLGLIRIIRFK